MPTSQLLWALNCALGLRLFGKAFEGPWDRIVKLEFRLVLQLPNSRKLVKRLWDLGFRGIILLEANEQTDGHFIMLHCASSAEAMLGISLVNGIS